MMEEALRNELKLSATYTCIYFHRSVHILIVFTTYRYHINNIQYLTSVVVVFKQLPWNIQYEHKRSPRLFQRFPHYMARI